MKPNRHNEGYLNTKRDKMGHLFPPGEGEEPPILGHDEQPA